MHRIQSGLRISLIVLLFSRCEKTFDVPPYRPSAESATLSISELKKRMAATGTHYRFGGGDTNLYCTITADETSGNFFRQVFVRDDEGSAIQLRLVHEGGLFTGDRIRINLNHLYVIMANNVVYLDSVNTEKNVVKISTGHEVTPKPVTVGGILAKAGFPADAGSLQNHLVELNGVEFVAEHRARPLADAVGKTAYEYTLTDCQGKTISLRSSGRANFAGKLTPDGNGKLVAIVTQYNDEMQLSLRSYTELKMSNAPCTGNTPPPANQATFALAAPVASIGEQFDNVSLNYNFEQAGWINFNETGNAKWKGSVKAGSYKSVRATSYSTGETNTIWLISPPVIYRQNLNLSFNAGCEYWVPGHPDALMCYVSTDFNGLNFSTANWTAVSNALYPNGTDVNYTGPLGMKNSGVIALKDLPLFKNYSGNLVAAFRYRGSPVYTSNIYLDDVRVE